MRRLCLPVSGLVLLLASHSWAVTDHKTLSANSYSAAQAKLSKHQHQPAKAHPTPSQLLANKQSHAVSSGYVAYLKTGSLHDNVKRIASEYGWSHVVWNVPEDYQWVGDVRVSADSLENLFAKFLNDYPLQAVFYQGNHILLIQPRTLR